MNLRCDLVFVFMPLISSHPVCIVLIGEYIGGCNDGPGLLPLSRENKLDYLLENAGVVRGQAI